MRARGDPRARVIWRTARRNYYEAGLEPLPMGDLIALAEALLTGSIPAAVTLH